MHIPGVRYVKYDSLSKQQLLRLFHSSFPDADSGGSHIPQSSMQVIYTLGV